MATWIQFVLQARPLDRKTDTWYVAPKEGGSTLGAVKFYGAWRKYCFFPSPNTIFEQDCLRDIATFCEGQTQLWRQK